MLMAEASPTIGLEGFDGPPPGEDSEEDPYADVDESGDDGWSEEYPQQEFHDSPQIPGTEPDAGDDEIRPDEKP